MQSAVPAIFGWGNCGTELVGVANPWLVPLEAQSKRGKPMPDTVWMDRNQRHDTPEIMDRPKDDLPKIKFN